MRLIAAILLLFSLFAHADDAEPLDPEQAFRFSARALDAQTVEVRYRIADGYYLYREKFKFSADAGVELGAAQFPPGQMKQDEFFGRVEIYHREVAIKLPINLASRTGATQSFTLKSISQGCGDIGVCYPPQTASATIALPQAASGAASAKPTPPAADESSRVAALFKGGGFWLAVASFFGFGLLLALTPCVFPMIPILSGIIVGQGQHLTKWRGFTLSLSYVLGMAITYALVGVAAGLSGSLLSNALQTPWVLGSFALVFVLLSLSMFGFYELQMPSFIQSWFNKEANQIKGGKLGGVFAMGALSAVIVGPCVAAPLAGALLYIGQTHDVLLGGAALFAMALGMGVPLLLVGLSAGALLPRAGGWMNTVKSFFGVLMLGMAIWLVSPVIPPVAHMLAWAALLIISAIYLHALDPLPHPAGGFRKFWKGAGVIALLVGVSLFVGALSGGRDILQPLSGFQASAAESKTAHLKFERVNSVADLENRLKQAAGKQVMLDFYADWCVSCKELERFTFADAKVAARLAGVVLLQADVTANSADDKALLQRFGLFGPPGVIFFGKDGQETGRMVGYEPPEKFLAGLETALR
ncbi:MAG: protein-disulfide reductase DsbD [Sulfuricellaceae bacterium]